MAKRATSTSWKPGRSGNPKGRPPGRPSLVPLIQKTTHDGKELVTFMLAIFRDPRMKLAHRMEAAEWLTDRGFGKATQAVELTDAEGGPLVIQLRWPEGE